MNPKVAPRVGGAMYEWVSWVATIATIGGALLTASNLGARVTGAGFMVFLFGSISWLAVGLISQQQALIWTNVVLTVLNVFGIWRWLGRQAAMEKGGQRAAEASEDLPSETLFPASLFTKGAVFDTSGDEMAKCVDAMLEHGSGKPKYLVISEGGVAGAGETLRRLPWSEVRPRDTGFDTGLVGSELVSYESIDRGRWPGR